VYTFVYTAVYMVANTSVFTDVRTIVYTQTKGQATMPKAERDRQLTIARLVDAFQAKPIAEASGEEFALMLTEHHVAILSPRSRSTGERKVIAME